jgi:hypothetical protein
MIGLYRINLDDQPEREAWADAFRLILRTEPVGLRKRANGTAMTIWEFLAHEQALALAGQTGDLEFSPLAGMVRLATKMAAERDEISGRWLRRIASQEDQYTIELGISTFDAALRKVAGDPKFGAGAEAILARSVA